MRTKTKIAKTRFASPTEQDEAVIEDINKRLRRKTLPPGERIKLDALIVINHIRVAAGFPALVDMPQGQVGDAMDCPIFNALKDLGIEEVGGSQISFTELVSDEEGVENPAEFVEGFAPALNGNGQLHVLDDWSVDPESFGRSAAGHITVANDAFGKFINAFDNGTYTELQLLNEALTREQRAELLKAEDTFEKAHTKTA